MNRRWTRTWWFLLLPMLLALGGGCSIEPLAGGVTETGNPEMVACAREMFQAMQPGHVWVVDSQVPGGKQRLDPASIYGAAVDTVVPGLGKTAARSDSTNFVRRSLVVPETTIIIDTLFSKRVVTDTVVGTSGLDTTVTLTRRIVIDSVLVQDTIVTADTLYFYDVPVSASPDSSENILDYYSKAPQYVDAVYSPSNGLSYLFLSGTISYALPAGSGNFRVNEGSPHIMSTSRVFTSSTGVRVWEEYRDFDGDSLLYTAPMPNPVQVRFGTSIFAPQVQESTLIDYDAGEDGILGTTNDNRIRSLVRELRASEGTNRLTFEYPTDDSPIVRFEAVRTSGPVRFFSNRFAVKGATGALTAMHPAWSYRLGDVDSLAASLELSSPVAPGGHPIEAGVRFVCILRSGDVGTFTGRIDAGSGDLTGTYEKSGTTVRIRATRDGTVVYE